MVVRVVEGGILVVAAAVDVVGVVVLAVAVVL